MVSMAARRPVDGHILTAARRAMQGHLRPPLSRASRRTHDRRAGPEPRAPAALGLLLHLKWVGGRRGLLRPDQAADEEGDFGDRRAPPLFRPPPKPLPPS